MKSVILLLAALSVASILGGCIIYTPPDPDGPDFYSPAIRYNPPPALVEIVHSDIEWLVWEYYDWDYDIVYDLRYRYKYTPDEVALILFLAYHGRVEPIRIVQWRQANTPWMTITTYHLRLQPDIFFVPVSTAYQFGPPYGHAYGRYWKNPKAVVLSDDEMINLVYLKTTCQAYNVSPVEVIKLREQGRDFNQIVWVHRSEGRHIKTTRGREIQEPPAKIKMQPVVYDKDKDKGKIISGAMDRMERAQEGEPEKGKPGLRPGVNDGIGSGNKEDNPVDSSAERDKPKTDKDKPSKDKGKDKPSKDKGGKGKKDK
ncbi:MAG: hypothetical protein AB1599_00510 [Planctomycetota bacterium]